ncbi:PTS system, cellobiose-specific IIA component [Enterococcus sp. DIV2402]|uniref:PTS system, cellobiose-specific IIA component n=1 Tax=Candidatus Enterococcus lowellii TaxID=2230877 RepID=A0ABZ2SSM4_9ENTE|nr:PTS lactose/cellobiose transporter subunit IIA [Enterococcus sp. DIV2402]MBO0464042.1 PTS lactose/cellobiose transporter subunit IIA [Enterococcus sp. DIV2402]
MEQEIMNIILNAGDAKAKCLVALRTARKGDFEKAEEQLKAASESMILAHKVQTDLIQAEVRGEKQELSLLMIHAQDHLMTAMTIKDMVLEMIEYAKDLNKLKKELK